MRGLAPFSGDAPVLGDVWTLKNNPALNKRIISGIVDRMIPSNLLKNLPNDITPDNYRMMLKGDQTAKKAITDAGYTIIGETRAYFARSGVPGATCTNPLPFITQPRLEKKGTLVTIEASLSGEVSFSSATANDVNTPEMDVSTLSA